MALFWPCLIQIYLLLLCELTCSNASLVRLPMAKLKQRGLYRSKVTASLAAIPGPGNGKMFYYGQLRVTLHLYKHKS